MIQGELKHIGSSTQLKTTYGQGYKLTLTCPADTQTRSNIDRYPPCPLLFVFRVNCRFMKENFSCGYTKVVESLVSVVYEINASSDVIAQVVQEVENRKVVLGVGDWGISPATLDDVFIRLCDGAGHEG